MGSIIGRQEGLEEGLQRGKQQGKQEGKQEGRQEGLYEGLQKAATTLAQRGLSMAEIANSLELSKSEVERMLS